MTIGIARNEKNYQVINRSRIAGRILFSPKANYEFPLRLAKMIYEVQGKVVAETTADEEGRFEFKNVTDFNGRIQCTMICMIGGDEGFELKKIGGEPYRFRFPEDEDKMISSLDGSPESLKIMLKKPEWQPDFIYREIIISCIPGMALPKFKEEIAHLYDDEIKGYA